MKVLLTGGAGFIGAHCVEYFLENTDWHLFIIDSFRHKGVYSRLNEIVGYNYERVKIFSHDLTAPVDGILTNRLTERDLHDEIPIDIIVNMASDSAVERSVANPAACWRNNCELVLNMLELARVVRPKLFLQISTDEVYGEAKNKPHHEWDVIMPSNPYSASKAAQESLSIAYWRTYNLPIVILNIMNAVGEWQDKEKFLPKCIWKVATDQIMEIYGEPGKIGSRYYIHCKNIADAICFLSDRLPAMYADGAERPDRYNIVGDIEMDNLEVAKYVATVMGKELKYKLIPSESARPGYDKRYALDGKKIADLGWRPPIPTLEAIERMVHWSIANPHWVV